MGHQYNLMSGSRGRRGRVILSYPSVIVDTHIMVLLLYRNESQQTHLDTFILEPFEEIYH